MTIWVTYGTRVKNFPKSIKIPKYFRKILIRVKEYIISINIFMPI